MVVDAAALAERSRELEGRPPEEILAFALAEYAPRVAISTAFGVEGCALVDMAVRLDAGVKVFTVDTGYLFAETYELVRRLEQRYGITVERFSGSVSREQQEGTLGERLWERDAERCCALRKVEPTVRAVSGLDAWIAGLRRDQGPSRAGIGILERHDHDDGTPLVKVNPLACWTRADTWRYVVANGVPYSPLLDQGYKSIGCWPCTRPVADGEDERAGRWAGTANAGGECGIHTLSARK